MSCTIHPTNFKFVDMDTPEIARQWDKLIHGTNFKFVDVAKIQIWNYSTTEQCDWSCTKKEGGRQFYTGTNSPFVLVFLPSLRLGNVFPLVY